KAKDSKIVSDCRHLLKHPDNLIGSVAKF
ncbi:cell-wall-anchored protein SasK(LPXTG motif), partial [Staphylococcus aureus]|nr:cell-wall-anchored protein SasK(LPXTG motif) [Staphylococcus aureus]